MSEDLKNSLVVSFFYILFDIEQKILTSYALFNISVPPERPTYRASRKPTAVRVYTVNQESRYCIIL